MQEQVSRAAGTAAGLMLRDEPVLLRVGRWKKELRNERSSVVMPV